VNLRLGDSAISPGCALAPVNATTDVESMSCSASTIFSTGKLVPVAPAPVGNNGFEIKTRNVRPLGLCAVLDEFPLPPQEIMVTLAAMSTNRLSKSLFKPGTPKSVKDRDLDARKRIIPERPRRISAAALCLGAAQIQKQRPIVVF